MFKALAVGALIAAMMVCAALAQTPAPAVVSLSELTAPARLHDATVSPSGRYIAIVRRSGDHDILSVVDWQARKQTVLATNNGFDVSYVEWLRWKGDDRLVFSFFGYAYQRSGGKVRPAPQGSSAGGRIGGFLSKLIAMDRDGTDLKVLGSGSLIQDMPADRDHILITGRDNDSLGRWLKAIKVDVRTGEREILDAGNAQTRYWEADRTGKLILRFDLNSRNGNFQVLAREGEDGWRDLFALQPRDSRWMADLEILSFSQELGKVYVAVKPKTDDAAGGDTRELRLYDFVKRIMGPKIWSHERYDFDGVIYGDDGQTVAGACYWADRYQCDFMDETLKRDYAAAQKAIGGDRSLILGSASASGDIRIVSASTPSEPGRIYVFDRRSGKADLLGLQWPMLKPEQLGVASRVSWKARDGTGLEGYLTEPPGQPKGPLPLILMPHGGPEARDHLDFQSWTQAFATRGYLVFQPNFRGSGGFGSRFAEQGYGQWGLKMQDDVLDGVQALIDQGKVDPQRICVVGASYGGYVSLYAGAKHPELFKCVVSFAGVSDLVASQKWERTVAGADSFRYQYWFKSIGDPDKDHERLTATSPITYAGTYGPPVLLIHGEQDRTVPITQSRNMEAALRKAGRSVRLIEYPNEEHSGWDSVNEVSALTEMLTFVDKAIGPKPR